MATARQFVTSAPRGKYSDAVQDLGVGQSGNTGSAEVVSATPCKIQVGRYTSATFALRNRSIDYTWHNG